MGFGVALRVLDTQSTKTVQVDLVSAKGRLR